MLQGFRSLLGDSSGTLFLLIKFFFHKFFKGGLKWFNDVADELILYCLLLIEFSARVSSKDLIASLMWPLALCSLFSNLSSIAAFRDLMASMMWTLVSRFFFSNFLSTFASIDTILIRIEFCTVEKVVYEWYTAPTTTAIAMVTLLDSEINRAVPEYSC